MGLGEWFKIFCVNLRIQDGGTVSTRCKRITRRLNSDFRNTDSETTNRLYVGSYGRNSAIRDVSDVDILYEMPVSEYHKYNAYTSNGQSSLLQAVKTSLVKTYPTSQIAGDGQVVVIKFDDGISFDVLPAFSNTDESYTFANANDGGSWKTTDPKPEISAMKERNDACNGNLTELCRMMRSWKNEWTVPIGGLLIDTLAYQFLENWAHRKEAYLYYDFMCRDFFLFMSEQSSSQTYWSAPGSGRRVYKDGLFQYKAKQCYNLSNDAIAYEQKKPTQEWSAKSKWREIFGTRFPT